jgi:predicted nucleic acid-binding protein
LFVDTNVLVYATRQVSQWHAPARTALEQLAETDEPIRISRQILREYLAATTRPQPGTVPLTMAQALADVAGFAAAFEVLEDGPAVMQELVVLCRAVPLGGRQVHDANIVATMLTHGETRLLTFNAADFTRFQPRIEVVVP